MTYLGFLARGCIGSAANCGQARLYQVTGMGLFFSLFLRRRISEYGLKYGLSEYGLQNQYNRVTVRLLMHGALPSYRHGVTPLNRIRSNYGGLTLISVTAKVFGVIHLKRARGGAVVVSSPIKLNVLCSTTGRDTYLVR